MLDLVEQFGFLLAALGFVLLLLQLVFLFLELCFSEFLLDIPVFFELLEFFNSHVHEYFN